MSDLPHGWETASLSDLIGQDGVFSDGDWIESKDQDPDGATRLLQLADIGDGKFLDKSARFVNDATFKRLRCTEIAEDDILIARMPDPLGRACLAPSLPQRCITVVDVAIVRPGKQSVNPKWLMHSLNAPEIRQGIQIQASGSTRQRIARGKLAEMPLPVPPKAEQKRITDKLDVVLARVDSCHNRLARIPAILKRFRQSILAAATSGVLTEDWRTENSVSTDGWKICSLGGLVETSANGLSKRRADVGNETTVLRLADFKNSERIWGNERTIRLDDKEIAKYGLSHGDLLVVRVNGSADLAGRFIVYEPHGEQLEAYCDHFIRLRLDRRRINPRFIRFVANSGAGRRYIESVLVTSAGQKTINKTSLFELGVPLPSVSEQTEIIRRVETLFAFADRLETRYTAARAQVEKLTPSLLAKAFRGELVPQNPNDEPASLLLSRLRQAAQGLEPIRPSRGRRK